jgi:mxaJ protein
MNTQFHIFKRPMAHWMAVGAVCACLAGTAFAATDEPVLRVCAGANDAPYSTSKEDGFENRIAELLGEAMGRKVEFAWEEKPAIYVVRDQLEKGNCDVLIGVDTNDQRLSTTKPYYRAPYVFVERTDSPLDITSFESPDLRKAENIGYIPGTPPEVMMVKLGLYSKNFNYVKSLTNFKSPRNQYIRIDPARMVNEVADGTADLAIIFAPEAARYVKEKDGKVKMVVVPDENERVDGEKVPFHFDQAVGVRKGDEKLLEELNAALEKVRPEILTILEEEGIPLQQPSTPGTRS